MKFSFTIIFSLCMFFAFAQTPTSGIVDTTENVLIGIDSGSELNFFYEDTTDFAVLDLAEESGHALFINPADDLLYGIIDIDGSNNNRNLFQINPFEGSFAQVHSYANTHMHTGDIGEEGIVYAVTGNGTDGVPSTVIALDLATGLETDLYVTGATDSRGLEYNPSDSSLYIYEGFSDLVYVYDLATGVETALATTGMSGEIHGVYYSEEEDNFLLTTYDGKMYATDPSYVAGVQVAAPSNSLMDLCELKILAGESVQSICPGDETTLSTLYSSNTISWYKDGVIIPAENAMTLTVSDPGEYRAVLEIENFSSTWMWSEPITVEYFTVPNVMITQADNDDDICLGEMVTLQGANGGSLQWFLDGTAISGANAATYDAEEPGSYNQLKTNMSGCSDSSAVAYVITVDPACPVSIHNTIEQEIAIYPNPVSSTLFIEADSEIKAIRLMDITSKEIIRLNNLNTLQYSIDFQSVESGVYLLEIETEKGFVLERIMR